MNEVKFMPPLKVLIVEDSVFIASRLKRMLEENKYACTGIARSVVEARNIIDKNIPHVVILDIHLINETEEGGGLDLLRILKRDHPEVNVMMFTNFTDSPYRELCKALGAEHFFDKSNDFHRIPEVLNSYLN